VAFANITVLLPPSEHWHYQKEYENILGIVPRIVCTSMIAYFAAEFCNSYMLAKLKLFYNGETLWARVIFSSIIGISVNSLLFVFIAYFGTIPINEMLVFATTVYLIFFL